MKIFYIANIRLPSEKAHAIQIVKMCEAFAKLGHEVELIVPNRRSVIPESPLEYYGVKTSFSIVKLFSFDIEWRDDFSFWLQTLSFVLSTAIYLRNKRYDMLYGRDEQVLAPLSLLIEAKKILWETHDGSWNLCARFIARRSNALVTVSKGAKDHYVQLGISASRILAIPNGVEITNFELQQHADDVREKLGIPLKGKVILYVGHLESWRGAEILLKAVPFLSEDMHVVIIGGTEKKISELRSIYPNAFFTGYLPYTLLPHNLSVADILILPNSAKNTISAHFTSPLKLFAYMASGKPIVATDIPSIRELVSEREVLFVKPDDPKALAEGITFLLDNPDISDRFGQNSRLKANTYTWVARAQGIIDFILPRLRQANLVLPEHHEILEAPSPK